MAGCAPPDAKLAQRAPSTPAEGTGAPIATFAPPPTPADRDPLGDGSGPAVLPAAPAGHLPGPCEVRETDAPSNSPHLSDTFAYDSAGRMTEWATYSRTEWWSYDDAGRLLSDDVYISASMYPYDQSWTYDASGRLLTYSIGNGTDKGNTVTTYHYDASGQLQTATTAENGTPLSTTSYQLAPDGQPTAASTVDTSGHLLETELWSYASDGSLTEDSKLELDSTGAVSYLTTDRYDHQLPLEREVWSGSDGTTQRITYRYFANNLLHVMKDITLTAQGSDETDTTYRYDDAGNRVQEIVANVGGAGHGTTQTLRTFDAAGNWQLEQTYLPDHNLTRTRVADYTCPAS